MWHKLPATHPSLAGHFPGEPIAPGVVVLDFVIRELRNFTGMDVMVDGVPMVKFIQPLRPEIAFAIRFKSVSDSKVNFEVFGENQDVFSAGQLHFAVTK